jgi:hypothetical protein
VIARPDVLRGSAGSWQARALLYTVAALSAAGLSGLVLGTLGRAIDPSTRAGAATLLAAVGLFVGLVRLAGARLAPLQCDRETPQSWLHQGLRLAAIKNGLALGNGATTRLGFWSWYLIPLSALLLGDPLAGAAIYGVYGLTRGVSAWIWIVMTVRAHRIGADPRDIPPRILGWGHVASYVSAAQLTAVATVVLVAVGF